MSEKNNNTFNEEELDPESLSIKIIDWSKNELLMSASVEIAATSEEFEWVLPKNDKVEAEKEGKLSIFFKKKLKNDKNEYPLWMRMILSIVLALSVGLILGKGIIFFISLSIDQKATLAPPTVQEVVAPVTTEQDSFELPELVTYVAQVGVFTTIEAANIEKENLQKKGVLSTVVEMDNKFVLLLTVANSMEAVKGLANTLLLGKGIDVYSKEVVFPGKSLQVSEPEFVQINDLYETFFYQLSIVTLLANKLPLNEELKKEWQIVLNNFNKEELPTAYHPLYELLLAGYEQLTTNATPQEIINQQQKLLYFLSVYQKL